MTLSKNPMTIAQIIAQGALMGAALAVTLGAGYGATRPLLGARGRITDRPGSPRPGGRVHKGWDVGVPYGTPIYAPWAGRVFRRKTDLGGLVVGVAEGPNPGDRIIAIAHVGVYAQPHGAEVNAGDLLAYTGPTGYRSGPVAHVEIARLEQGGRTTALDLAALPGGITEG